MGPVVVAVSRNPEYGFTKPNHDAIELLQGLGVAGDVHAGTTVRHQYLVRHDPGAPNLRQVHLIHDELFDELRGGGFTVRPGELGENVTTRGLDVLGLPRGTRLHLGEHAVVQVTGLRHPCRKINALAPGLMKAVLDRDEHGGVVRKAGVMAVVVTGGTVRPGDEIRAVLPTRPHQVLEPV